MRALGRYKPRLVSDLYELDIQKDIVSETTAQFCSAVASKLRGVKFGNRFQDSKVRTGEHVHVYYPEDKYALGVLQVVHADVDEFVYAYSSRKIHNERSKNTEPNTKRTTNLDRAVRDVSKFFVPYTPIEEAIESSDRAQKAFRKTVEGARRMQNMVRGMFASLIEGGYTHWKNDYEREFTSAPDRRDILTELGRIVEQHDFMDFRVRDLFINMITTEEDQQREEIMFNDGHATYVRIVNNERAIIVKDIPNKELGRLGHLDTDKYVVVKVLVQDMPDYVQGSIAVLSMLDVGDSVPDLGLRVATDTFYVNQKEQ
jgi:hypothetical protein